MKKILLCLLAIGLSASLYAADTDDSSAATLNNEPNTTTEMNNDTNSDSEMNNDVNVNEDAGVNTDAAPGPTDVPVDANPGSTPGR